MRTGKNSWRAYEHGKNEHDYTERNICRQKRHCNNKRAGGVAAGHTFTLSFFAENRLDSVLFIRPRFIYNTPEDRGKKQHCKRECAQLKQISSVIVKGVKQKHGVWNEHKIRQNLVNYWKRQMRFFVCLKERNGTLISFSVHTPIITQFFSGRTL